MFEKYSCKLQLSSKLIMNFVFILFNVLLIQSNQTSRCKVPLYDLYFPTIGYSDLNKGNKDLIIYPVFDDIYSSKKYITFTTVIYEAIAYWQKILAPRHKLTENIKLMRNCKGKFIKKKIGNTEKFVCDDAGYAKETYCGPFLVNASYLEENNSSKKFNTNYQKNNSIGVSADLLVFFSSSKQDCDENVTGYGSPCQLNQFDNRPLAGVINLCPKSVKTHKFKSNIYFYKRFFIHELAHILGIHSSLYAFYRNPDNSPQTERGTDGLPKENITFDKGIYYVPSNDTIQNFEFNRNYVTGHITSFQYVLHTPKAREFTSEYFGCRHEESIGIQMENYGDNYSAMSHFESRIFQYELMTTNLDVPMTMSDFTLTALFDTGWYIIQGNGENFDIGKGVGCDLLTLSCCDYMDNRHKKYQSLLPFCIDPMNICAGGSNTLMLICDIQFGKNSTDNMSCFNANNVYVDNPFAENCPTFVPLQIESNYLDCTNRKIKLDPDEFWFYEMGNDSQCITKPAGMTQRVDLLTENVTYEKDYIAYAGCYKVKCHMVTFAVTIGNITKECQDKNLLNFPLSNKNYQYSIYISCPKFHLVCENDFSPTTAPNTNNGYDHLVICNINLKFITLILIAILL